jgi:hypothetical protein
MSSWSVAEIKIELEDTGFPKFPEPQAPKIGQDTIHERFVEGQVMQPSKARHILNWPEMEHRAMRQRSSTEFQEARSFFWSDLEALNRMLWTSSSTNFNYPDAWELHPSTQWIKSKLQRNSCTEPISFGSGSHVGNIRPSSCHSRRYLELYGISTSILGTL